MASRKEPLICACHYQPVLRYFPGLGKQPTAEHQRWRAAQSHRRELPGEERQFKAITCMLVGVLRTPLALRAASLLQEEGCSFHHEKALT